MQESAAELQSLGVAVLILGSGMLVFLLFFFLTHVACIYCCCIADTRLKDYNRYAKPVQKRTARMRAQVNSMTFKKSMFFNRFEQSMAW